MSINPFRRRGRAASEPQRCYAIGDVHGRLDLFVTMIARIKADTQSRTPASTRLIILGDFIDRGPDSAGVIDVLMRLREEANLIVLKGNHEATLVDALAGDFTKLDMWLAHGGMATLRSFGIEAEALDVDDTQLLRLTRDSIPAETRAWLAALPTSIRFGRYLFVHAGVRPGIALNKQTDADRLWIRDEFIDSTADHGAVVVHGHTINEAGVVIAPNRIGVDTGAYRTGRLSAVGLEEQEVWTVTVDGAPGAP